MAWNTPYHAVRFSGTSSGVTIPDWHRDVKLESPTRAAAVDDRNARYWKSSQTCDAVDDYNADS